MYVDLTCCQGSLKAAAEINGESLFMLVTDDATLNGLVVPDSRYSALGFTLTPFRERDFIEKAGRRHQEHDQPKNVTTINMPKPKCDMKMTILVNDNWNKHLKPDPKAKIQKEVIKRG